MHPLPVLLSALLFAAALAPASAQDGQPRTQPAASAEEVEAEGGEAETEKLAKPQGPPQDLTLSFSARQSLETRSQIDDGPADLSVYRSSVQLRASRFFGYLGRGSVGAAYEWSRYDLGDAQNLDPPRPRTSKDPWDRLHQLRFNLEGQLFLSRSFYLSTFLSGRLGFEEGSDLGESFSLGAFLLAGWRITPEVDLLFGAGLVTQLEDSPRGFPGIGIRWKVTDWLRIDLLGPMLRATLTPRDDLELTFSVQAQNRQYRFARRRSLFARHVLQDQQVRVVASARWFPWEHLGIRTELGVIAYRELELQDRRGEKVYRLQTGPSLLVSLGVELRF